MSRLFLSTDDGYYGSNPYYDPEKCGLVLLGEIETAGSYEFCTTIALKDIDTEEVFLAQDSGCSCPTPFESFKGTGDFIPYENDDQVRRLLDDHHYTKASSTDVHSFIVKIHEALPAWR